MQKLLRWLDNHILEYLSFALIIFIPLFPKIPLADLIPGYIVRLRLDDLLVGFAFAIWIVQLVRKKVSLKGNLLFIPILIYILIGFISSLSALFITKTVPLSDVHIAKLFLNWARRIEYVSVFFIFLSSIKNLGQIKKYVVASVIVLFLVSIYGFGQKCFNYPAFSLSEAKFFIAQQCPYFPAFSTMNREFSKGVRLYLTEDARVLSTFGGHYDLAAYLMIVLTTFIPLGFAVKNKKARFFLLFGSLCGFWLLILTVSRASFLAYLVSITIAFGLLASKIGYLKAGIRWFFVVTISLSIMLSFGQLSDRFERILKVDKIRSMFKAQTAPPSGPGVAYLDVGLKSDVPPSMERPSSITNATPSDVTENVPEFGNDKSLPASMSAKPRTYSQAARQFDLSTGIRLDATWPSAIKGFTTNPLLGTGYSTLTKKNVEDFTEAESTDNDFLRALGETGMLGFLSFFGLVGFIIYTGIKNLKHIADPFAYTLVASIVAAIIGLLINAIYIDVFEASKVAYTFWTVTAILLGTIKFSAKPQSGK